MIHEPSLPSTSTEPDMPSLPPRVFSCAERMSVSASHLYSTSGGVPFAGSSWTAMFTVSLLVGRESVGVSSGATVETVRAVAFFESLTLRAAPGRKSFAIFRVGAAQLRYSRDALSLEVGTFFHQILGFNQWIVVHS